MIVSLHKENDNASFRPPFSPMAGHTPLNIYRDHQQSIWYWPFYANIKFLAKYLTDIALGPAKAKIPKTLTSTANAKFSIIVWNIGSRSIEGLLNPKVF